MSSTTRRCPEPPEQRGGLDNRADRQLRGTSRVSWAAALAIFFTLTRARAPRGARPIPPAAEPPSCRVGCEEASRLIIETVFSADLVKILLPIAAA